MDKVKVNGKDADPVYKFLKQQTGTWVVTWNFQKWLIAANGTVEGRCATTTNPLKAHSTPLCDSFQPTTSPLKLEPQIQKLLAATSAAECGTSAS